MTPPASIVALAGRRIDHPDADKEQFPPRSIERVSNALRDFFRRARPRELFCSGAAGADLLAVRAAAESGVEQTMVLPFDRATFCELSVADRDGPWTAWFDEACDRASAKRKLFELGENPKHPEAAYLAANELILQLAGEAARGADPLVVVVWDRESRGGDDATCAFHAAAEKRRWQVESIPTL